MLLKIVSFFLFFFQNERFQPKVCILDQNFRTIKNFSTNLRQPGVVKEMPPCGFCLITPPSTTTSLQTFLINFVDREEGVNTEPKVVA